MSDIELRDKIIGVVADFLRLSRLEVYSGATWRCESARLIVYFYLRMRSAMTFCRIGELMGVKHSTVVHGIQSVADRTLNYEYCRTLDTIGRLIDSSESATKTIMARVTDPAADAETMLRQCEQAVGLARAEWEAENTSSNEMMSTMTK